MDVLLLLLIISQDEVFIVVPLLISVDSVAEWRNRVLQERFSFTEPEIKLKEFFNNSFQS